MRLQITSTDTPGTEAAARLARIEQAMAPERIDRVVRIVAAKALAEVVDATPKGWTGTTRAAWRMEQVEPGHWRVFNPTNQMKYLEWGTRAHGPRETFGPIQPGGQRKKAALFIPLTAKAAMSDRRFFGAGLFNYRAAAGTVKKRGIIVRRGKKGSTLLYGIDYVLARWVRGITARHIAQRQEEKSRATLLEDAKQYIRKAAGL